MKTCLLLGSKSDIAQAITPMLDADGYRVIGWHRDERMIQTPMWDLLIIAMGTVAPVGLWKDVSPEDWTSNIHSNLIRPFQLLHTIWPAHKPDATVIWFAGSNPQKIMDGYSAYNCAKMAVIKLVEQLDHETPDCKFVAFGPGYVKTKIHDATLKANWPNERIERGDDGNSMEAVYKAMMWCVGQPKEMVGGRNICVSDVQQGGIDLQIHDFGKLRRVE